jgi:ubiquinone/menaquinone biosynthesis C-methylase UbiE
MTTALLDRVGVPEGARCLDVGSGSGDVSFELARRVGSRGTVIGIDMDELKLDLARELAAEQGLTNVTFERADLTDWQASESYDLVFCRFVLQHMRDPHDLLRRMWAAAAPGGVLVAVDTDFDGSFCYPPNEGFRFYATNYPQLVRAHGGDPMIGVKLRSYFLDAGIEWPSVMLSQQVAVDGAAKIVALLTLQNTAEQMADSGIATMQEIDAHIADLEAFIRDPDSMVSDPRVFQVWARRP